MPTQLNDDLDALASQLSQRGWRLITAESCTGGLVSATLTDIPGSSEWFEGAFITYRLSAKIRMLGVSEETLERHGAVSEPVVREMAQGALRHSDADLSVAITGVAGPAGGEPLLPVGTVWFGWCDRAGLIQSAVRTFEGDRQAVRIAATAFAIRGLVRAMTRPD